MAISKLTEAIEISREPVHHILREAWMTGKSIFSREQLKESI